MNSGKLHKSQKTSDRALLKPALEEEEAISDMIGDQACRVRLKGTRARSGLPAP